MRPEGIKVKKLKGYTPILASIFLLIGILVYGASKGMFVSIAAEIERYKDINLWYFGITGLFIIGSYLMGWLSYKIRSFDL